MREQFKPDVFKGTYTAPREGKCVRCKGAILKGEYFRLTPNGAWIGPCCG